MIRTLNSTRVTEPALPLHSRNRPANLTPRNKDWMSNVNVSPETLFCFLGELTNLSD